jgi:phasin
MSSGFEIPVEMRAFAEKSVGEARKAFEGYMDAATKALGTMEKSAENLQANNRDLGRKAMGFAEDNVAASLDFIQRLVNARDVQEVVRLQTEFTQAQIKNLADQAKALGSSVAEAGREATEAGKAAFDKATKG